VASTNPAATSALPGRCIRLRELQQFVPYSKVHIYRLERSDPAFPKRIRIGPGRVVWRLSEVLAYLDAKPRGPGSAAAPHQPAADPHQDSVNPDATPMQRRTRCS